MLLHDNNTVITPFGYILWEFSYTVTKNSSYLIFFIYIDIFDSLLFVMQSECDKWVLCWEVFQIYFSPVPSQLERIILKRQLFQGCFMSLIHHNHLAFAQWLNVDVWTWQHSNKTDPNSSQWLSRDVSVQSVPADVTCYCAVWASYLIKNTFFKVVCVLFSSTNLAQAMMWVLSRTFCLANLWKLGCSWNMFLKITDHYFCSSVFWCQWHRN